MKIAVLSGKGGTGKTTVAVNLAKAMNWNYADCDVEEPNGFIFLKPEITKHEEVLVKVPRINKELCIQCQECVKVCQFNALAGTPTDIIVFDKLCHSCSACMLKCKVNAITEETRPIGITQEGESGSIQCISGLLNISEPMAVPVIKQVKSKIGDKTTIIDCSPGTSCSVTSAIDSVDYAILVTEPTQFGLHDLQRAIKLLKMYDIPFGIIVNRANDKDSIIFELCEQEKYNLLGTIPFDKKIAKLYSNGKLLVEDKQIEDLFIQMGNKIMKVISCS